MVDDGEGAEAVALGFDEVEDVADGDFGDDFDGVLDEAMDVVFDAGDFLDLLLLGHVIMNKA